MQRYAVVSWQVWTGQVLVGDTLPGPLQTGRGGQRARTALRETVVGCYLGNDGSPWVACPAEEGLLAPRRASIIPTIGNVSVFETTDRMPASSAYLSSSALAC